MPSMNLTDAINLAGSKSALARLLGVSHQAVCKWNKDGRMPPLQVYRLKDIKPRWFRKPAASKPTNGSTNGG